MGDRCNVAIKVRKDDENHIFVYSHWGGHEMPGEVLNAVKKAKCRWDDDMYCCRIIIDNILPEGSKDQGTGYGISLHVGDNSYPIIEIDIPKQVVRLIRFDSNAWEVIWDDVLGEHSFEDFAKMDSVGWEGMRTDS